MTKFPVESLGFRIARKGLAYDHLFCANCGKELTKFNFKTSRLKQETHFIVNTVMGVQLRYCWRKTMCEQRRSAKYRDTKENEEGRID